MSGIVGLFTNIRDLMKYSAAFRWGFIVLVFVVFLAGLSWFSPYEEDHRRDTPRSKPPLTEISIGRDDEATASMRAPCWARPRRDRTYSGS